MATTGSSQLVRKLSSFLQEPDDLSVWRYTVAARSYRDQAWAQYVAAYHIAEKIQAAKENGTWNAILGRFLEGASSGHVPLSAFLTEDGRDWLRSMSVRLSR